MLKHWLRLSITTYCCIRKLKSASFTGSLDMSTLLMIGNQISALAKSLLVMLLLVEFILQFSCPITDEGNLIPCPRQGLSLKDTSSTLGCKTYSCTYCFISLNFSLSTYCEESGDSLTLSQPSLEISSTFPLFGSIVFVGDKKDLSIRLAIDFTDP